MKKIEAEKVKANGISGRNPWPIVSKIKPIIETAISVYRLRNTNEEIFESISKLSPNGDFYAGVRFTDNEAVVMRAISALNEAAFELTDNVEEAHELIYNFINNINGKDMDIIILDSLMDCAGADHWYKYEKQWD
jgi:hypothetical protein